MALIQAQRVSSGSGQEILSTTQDEVYEVAWTSGETITLSTIGSGVLEGTLVINFQEKLLTRGASYDYSFDGNQTITLNFDFDPTVYDPASVLIQISYAHYA
jgi:hypothetical protein